MKPYIKVVGGILCLLLALWFVAGLLFHEFLTLFAKHIPRFVQSDAYPYWGAIGMRVVVAGLAFWALVKFRRMPQWPRRVIFLLIVVIAIMMFATEIGAWMTPAFSAALRGPVETVLAYAFGISLAIGFLIEARQRRT